DDRSRATPQLEHVYRGPLTGLQSGRHEAHPPLLKVTTSPRLVIARGGRTRIAARSHGSAVLALDRSERASDRRRRRPPAADRRPPVPLLVDNLQAHRSASRDAARQERQLDAREEWHPNREQ